VEGTDSAEYYCDSASVWYGDCASSMVAKRIGFAHKQEDDIRIETISRKVMKENDFSGLEEFCQAIIGMIG